MNKKYIMIAVAGLGIAALTPLCFSQSQTEAAAATAPAAAAPVSPEQATKAFSYFIGYKFGQEVSAGVTTLTVDDFDKDVFFAAMQQSLKGEAPAMTEEEIGAGMGAFVQALQEREAVKSAENLKKGQEYQAEFAKQDGVTKTASGVLYRVITPGEGEKYDPAKHGEGAICTLTYEGKHIDSRVFDKSTTPVDMQIDRVVPGFSEALMLMPVGSTWEVCIPSEQAYGPQGPGPIGNNATLIFTIKLDGIKKNEAPAGQGGMQLTPEMIQALQAQGLDAGQPMPLPVEGVPAEAAPAAPAEAAPAAPAPAPAPASETF